MKTKSTFTPEDLKKGLEAAEKGEYKRREMTESQRQGLLISHKNRKISRVKTLEKKFSDPNICEEVQRKKNTKEMSKLYHEIYNLEEDVATLLGKDSEYVDRSRKIKDKLLTCMRVQ